MPTAGLTATRRALEKDGSPSEACIRRTCRCGLGLGDKARLCNYPILDDEPRNIDNCDKTSVPAYRADRYKLRGKTKTKV